MIHTPHADTFTDSCQDENAGKATQDTKMSNVMAVFRPLWDF